MSALETAMATLKPERDRKAEHIELALEPRMQLGGRYFDDYWFEPEALPEIDFADVDPAVDFLGKRLSAPLLISSMTGGTESARRINRNLAAAAERAGIAVGLGSQRKALEDPAQASTFEVRDVAPTIPLLANLGAVQLNYGLGFAECRSAVDMIGADALILHLNPLQEALQPEGQRDFRGLLDKMGSLAAALPVPVIAKEVGCGISARTARALVARGIRTIDVAGVGGTSWARIEAARAGNPGIGEVFAGWGIPTPLALAEIRGIAGVTLIASGGLRNGLDVAKALALGADLAAMAYPFLEVATTSADRVLAKIESIVQELKTAMFCLGVHTISELRQVPLRKGSLR